jgi:hypothetical protein
MILNASAQRALRLRRTLDEHRVRIVGIDFLVGVNAEDGRHVERRGQEVDDGVEQRLHTLVLERRTADDGTKAAWPFSRTELFVRFLIAALISASVGSWPCRYFSRILSSASLTFSMSCSGSAWRRPSGRPECHRRRSRRPSFVFVGDRLHLDEVDDADELVF